MRLDHLRIPIHGRIVEVPRAQLEAELHRSGPVASLALVEAIVLAAPRAAAIARLSAALVGASANTGTLAALLGLVRLMAREAAPMMATALRHLTAPLSTASRAAALLLADDLPTLCALVEADDVVAQRVPLVLTALPSWLPSCDALVTVLLAALARLQPTLGITAYRAMLGDLAEALFRALQRGANADGLIGPHREALVDRLCAELPGTPDLVAARGMAWLLGVLAPTEDVTRSAIERARARFRDPAFFRDCSVILGEESALRWPP